MLTPRGEHFYLVGNVAVMLAVWTRPGSGGWHPRRPASTAIFVRFPRLLPLAMLWVS